MTTSGLYGSHTRITASVTDANGDPVAGATVGLEVFGPDGAVAHSAPMTDEGGGSYYAVVPPEDLPGERRRYRARTSVESLTGLKREAEVRLFTSVDGG